jgi:recombination protein RecT
MSEQQQNAPAVRKIDVLKNMLNAPSVQDQFKNALAENSGSFVASVIDLYNGDTSLQKCEPKQVVMEALKAAVLKLPINKALGFAYIISFNNSVKQADGSWVKVPTPTFMPGYKGYIQLAMRTGQYLTINADYVYEGEYKKKDKMTGFIDLSGEKTSEKVVGYFCHFELLNGFKKTLYVTVDEMARHAKKYSPSLKGDKEVTVDKLIKLANTTTASTAVGWLGNFGEMALKTTIRNLLSKYGYLSIEMQNVISADEAETARDEAINTINGTKTIDIESVDFEEKPEEKAVETQGPAY